MEGTVYIHTYKHTHTHIHICAYTQYVCMYTRIYYMDICRWYTCIKTLVHGLLLCGSGRLPRLLPVRGLGRSGLGRDGHLGRLEPAVARLHLG